MANEIPHPAQTPDRDPNAPQDPAQTAPSPPAPKRRKRRVWPYVLLGLLLVLALLVVFAPKLAGTAPVRNFVLGFVNDSLNGKVEVADWSVSWTKGITVKGLKVRDDKGDVVLQASDVRTQLSLWDTLKSGFSRFALGRTEVENLELTKFHIDENGTPNYARLAKDTGQPDRPSKPIDVSGDIHVGNMTGTVTAANMPQTIHIRPSSIDVSLKSLNDPIKHDMKLALAVDNSAPGMLSVAGETDLLDNGEVNADTAKIAQTLAMSGIDLAIANAFLAMAKNDLKLAGLANGNLNISLNGLANLAATGQLNIAKFEARGGPLKGDDVFRSDLTVPVKITRVVENGVDIFRIEDTRLQTNYGTVTIAANASQDAIRNLANNQPPGREGSFSITADFKDAAKLVTSLRNTFQLAAGTQVNSGQIFAQINGTMQKDRLVGKTELSIDNVAGVKKDEKTGQTQQITLAPIKQSLDVTYVPTEQPGDAFSLTQLKTAALNFSSAFFNLTGNTTPQGAQTRFTLKGDGDLAKLQQQVGQFVDMTNVSLGGNLDIAAGGTFEGKSFVFAKESPLKVAAQNLNVRLPAGEGRAQPVDVLKNRSIALTLAGALQMTDMFSVKAESLGLSSPNLFEIKNTGGPLSLTYGGGKVQGTGTLSVFADVKQVNDILKSMQPAPADGSAEPRQIAQLTRGLLNGTLALARADQPITKVDGNFTLDMALTTQDKPLTDKVGLTLTAAVPDDMAQETKASLDMKSQYATASASDVVAVLAHDNVFNQLRRATLTVTAPRLDAVQAILDSLMPQTTPAVASAQENPSARRAEVSDDDVISEEKPLPPLKIESGNLVLNAGLVREGQVTRLRDTRLSVTNLRFNRGEGRYDAGQRKIDLALAADIQTTKPQSAAATQPSLVDQISRIQLTQLSGNLDVGQLSMPKPIVITNPGAAAAGKLAATGAVELKGNLGDTFRLLEALGGAKPYSRYPYAGNYTMTQEVTTQDQKIRLAGKIDATDFRALDAADPKKTTFTEDHLAIVNDVAADLATDTLTINDVSIDMKSSGALRLAISNGQLVDWSDQRQITDKLTATLKADWGKLWKIVKPTLDPETVASLGEDFAIEGVTEQKFTVSGKYATTGRNRRGKVVTLPFQASIKQLHATGGLSIPRLFYKGFDARNANLPIILEKGVILVQDASKPKGEERIPEAFVVNGGRANFGGFKLDLTWVNPKDPTAITPLLSIPNRDHVVLDNIGINPVLAESVLGKYVNTAFSGSKEASGAVSLTAAYCDRLPLGAALQSADSPGSAQFVFSMSKVQLQGEGLQRLTGGVALALNQIARASGSDTSPFEGFQSVTGAITKSTITIERGRIQHRLNLETDRFGQWAFDGSLNIASKTYNQLNVKMPVAMFGVKGDLTRFLGETITVPFAGPISRPTVAPDFVGKFVQQNILKNPGNLLEGLLNRDRDGQDSRQPRDRDARDTRDRDMRDRDTRGGDPRTRESANQNRSRSADPLSDLFEDFADQFLDRGEQREARPAGSRQPRGQGNSQDIGNQRISGDRDEPAPAPRNQNRRPNRNRNTDPDRDTNRPTGDEKISSDPKDRDR